MKIKRCTQKYYFFLNHLFSNIAGMNGNAYNLISIIGPTASGKTSLAACLAKELGSCVISADSRQVYKGMDIGTGKDLADFIVDGEKVSFELIDICEAGSKYNVLPVSARFSACFSTIY